MVSVATSLPVASTTLLLPRYAGPDRGPSLHAVRLGRHQQIVQVTGKDVDCFIFPRSRTVPISSVSRCISTLMRTSSSPRLCASYPPGHCSGAGEMIHNDLLAIALFWRLIELRSAFSESWSTPSLRPRNIASRGEKAPLTAVRDDRNSRGISPFLFFTTHHRRN